MLVTDWKRAQGAGAAGLVQDRVGRQTPCCTERNPNRCLLPARWTVKALIVVIAPTAEANVRPPSDRIHTDETIARVQARELGLVVRRKRCKR